MLTFFLTIIIVYVFWLVIRPLAARYLSRYLSRKFQQRVENMFRNAYGEQGPEATTADRSRSRDHRAHRRAPRRKIFQADEGEYIEFQEITVETSYTSSSTTPTDAPHTSDSSGYTPREPRISDAEWEEIS